MTIQGITQYKVEATHVASISLVMAVRSSCCSDRSQVAGISCPKRYTYKQSITPSNLGQGDGSSYVLRYFAFQLCVPNSMYLIYRTHAAEYRISLLCIERIIVIILLTECGITEEDVL